MRNHLAVYYKLIRSGKTLSDRAKLAIDLPINFIMRNLSKLDPRYDLHKQRFGAVTLIDMFNRERKAYFHFDLFMLTDYYFSKSFTKILESKKYKNFLDIGSNVGIAGWYFLMQDQSRECIFVDPNTKVIDIAKTFWEDNKKLFPHKCTFVNCALGPKNGKATLNFTRVNDQAATLRDNKIHTIKHNKSQEIAVYTLDTMMKKKGVKKVDLIKIDVEGYEIEVIKGAKEFFKNIDKVDIVVEIWDDKNLNGFIEVLKSYPLKFTYKPIDYGNWDIKDYFFEIRRN